MDFQILNKIHENDILTELRNPAEYRGYLQVMSHFSSYSWRNIFLVYKQMPNATKLADFKSWKEYGRTIIQGITGIRINVPIKQPPKKKLVEKIDSSTGTAVLDEHGKRIMEELLVEQPVQFKPASYMDISQTEGAPVLFLAGDVLSDETLSGAFTDCLKTISTSNGQLDLYSVIKQIVRDRLENNDSEKDGFITNSVIFVLCWRFGVDDDTDFVGLDRLLDTETLEAICNNSDGLITDIEGRFAVICKERGLDPMTLPRTYENKQQEEPQPVSTAKQQKTQYVKELRTGTVAGIEFNQYTVKPVSATENKIADNIEIVTSAPEMVTVTTAEEQAATEASALKSTQNKQAKPAGPIEPPILKYLPDTAISIADRNEYGYTRPELLPLTKDRAINLFRRDMTVYLLNKDNTEVIAHYLSDIQKHDGIFGIAYGVWLNSREYIALASGNPEAQREARFIFDGGDSFAVYQTEQGNSPSAYKSYEELQVKGFDINRHKYKCIYTAPLPKSPSDTPAGLFMWVTAERLDGYNGRALAMSDVLSIKKDEIITSYYANGRAFKELLSFNGEEGLRTMREIEIIIAEQEKPVVSFATEMPQTEQQAEPIVSPPAVIETAITEITAAVKETSPAPASEPAVTQTALQAATITETPVASSTQEMPETPPPALPVIKSEQAVYKLSAKQAEEHGTTDVYELSRRMDIDCAKAVGEAIEAHKKGDNRYDLITPAEGLLNEYGAERITWVLSKHILTMPKRFSEANCAWAREFVNEETGNGDEIPAFAINTNYTVLDAFMNQFRDVLAKKPVFSERMKDAKKKSEAHNKSSG